MSARLEPSPLARDGEQAKRSIADVVVPELLRLCALVPVLALLGLVGTFVGSLVLGSFRDLSVWRTIDRSCAIPPLALGALLRATSLTTAIALVVSLPFGLSAAVYLSELASPKARRWFLPALETLAVVPPVVYGYFALVALTPPLAQIVPAGAARDTLAVGLAMGLMILPLVASRCEEALSRVPASLREGAYALGADKLATVRRVVLPTALPGIVAAVLLAIVRAVGEAVVVMVVAGVDWQGSPDPQGRFQTLASYVVEAVAAWNVYVCQKLDVRAVFVIGAALLAFTLLFDALAARLGVRRSKRAR